MTKRLWALAAALVLGTAVWAPGRAATPPANAATLKIGAFFPDASDARDAGGSTQFVIGLNDVLSKNGGTTPSATSVYIDYIGGSNSPASLHSTGIGVGLASTGSPYYGAGLGLYSTTASVNTEAGTLSHTTTGGGGKIFVGFELGGNTQLEFDYHVLPSAGGINPSGAGIELGIHL